MKSTDKAKNDAPRPREYRSLKRAAKNRVESGKYDNYDYRLECRFILRMMGDLGMRAGEVAHMHDDWVDYDQNQIVIPSHDLCTRGDDGGPCSYCKTQAELAAEHSDITYETALRDRWEPKNEHAARTIWFGWDSELVELIDEFMIKHGQFPRSRVTINRRIDTIAEASELVDPSDIYPHALRAHAAMYWARQGLTAYHLTELLGWAEPDAAMDYIKMTANDVQSEMKRVYNGKGRV